VRAIRRLVFRETNIAVDAREIPAAARDRILDGNLRRLILPILQAKGVKL